MEGSGGPTVIRDRTPVHVVGNQQGSGVRHEPSPVIDGRAEDRERFTGHVTTAAVSSGPPAPGSFDLQPPRRGNALNK